MGISTSGLAVDTSLSGKMPIVRPFFFLAPLQAAAMTLSRPPQIKYQPSSAIISPVVSAIASYSGGALDPPHTAMMGVLERLRDITKLKTRHLKKSLVHYSLGVLK